MKLRGSTGGGVRVDWVVRKSDIELRVDDEGPGLASDANLFVPFFTTETASINGFDFTAFGSDSGTADLVQWKVIARNSADANQGAFGQPFGNGEFDAAQVLFEGSEPFDIEAYADIGDQYGQRYFVDISTPFELAAGDYYFTCYGDNTAGSAAGSSPSSAGRARKLFSIHPTRARISSQGKPSSSMVSGSASLRSQTIR